MTDGRRFIVHDWDRVLTFTGRELGSASTFVEGKPRWSEVHIYRTDGGSYVAAGSGETTVPDEEPRRWAHVVDSPAGVVQALYQFDADGIRYMTNVARRALEDASARDDGIRDAFLIEEVA